MEYDYERRVENARSRQEELNEELLDLQDTLDKMDAIIQRMNQLTHDIANMEDKLERRF